MRETIGKILDIEREQERRYRNSALKRYNTGEKIHRKQLEFHRCQKRNRWVFGGNRTGKTECGAAVVTFDGGACTLILDGAPVAFGTSPISAAFDTGGELALDGERQNARALVIGG